MLKTIYLLSGLPGTGKSTLGTLIAGEDNVCSADDYPGLYSPDGTFNGGKIVGNLPLIAVAHQWCQQQVKQRCESGVKIIAVANTFCERWEATPYYEIGAMHGYLVQRVSLFNGGFSTDQLVSRNTHGVPHNAINAMRQRYQHGLEWHYGETENPYMS